MRTIWLVVVQVAVLALTALALYWATTAGDAPAAPARMDRVLLALFAVALLVLSPVAAWRRGHLASVLGGLALAFACRLCAGHLWEHPAFQSGYVPMIAPYIVGAAVVLAVLGLVLRAGIKDASRYGVAAAVGGIFLAVTGTAFYLLINRVPAFSALYMIEAYQYIELLAAVLLYPAALWLGSVGIRPAARLTVLPLGMVLLLGVYQVIWIMLAKGGQA